MQARRTLHHLRGAEKFEALIQDHLAREQTATALSYIHSWSRTQEQIRARRICMITEARIKQKKLETQLKIEAKIQELEVVLLLSARDCLVSTVFEVLLSL